MQAEALRMAEKRLREGRTAREAALAERRAQALAAAPEIARHEAAIADEHQRMLREAAGSPGDVQRIVRERRAAVQQQRTLIAQALQRAGMPADALDLQYACAKCRDDGYLYDPIARPCSCLERERMEALVQLSGLSMDEPCSFALFNAERFPETPMPELGGRTQRAHMKAVMRLCAQFAEDYPGTPQRGLLFTGPSGLGKTFLLQSIARRCMERGVPTLAVTAFRMVDAMRAYHFGDRDAHGLQLLLDVDLLCIDDLGAEPLLENITIPHLLTLLAERRARGRGIVIATNLSHRELMLRYSERVSSRLLDASYVSAIPFAGQDLRMTR